jgi:hypothetical protein
LKNLHQLLRKRFFPYKESMSPNEIPVANICPTLNFRYSSFFLTRNWEKSKKPILKRWTPYPTNQKLVVAPFPIHLFTLRANQLVSRLYPIEEIFFHQREENHG